MYRGGRGGKPFQQQQRAYQPQATPAAATSYSARHPSLLSMGLADKFPFEQKHRQLVDVCKRCPRRQVNQDLLSMECHYAGKSKSELGIPLNKSIEFELKNEEKVVLRETPAETAADASNTRHFAYAMVLSGAKEDEENSKQKLHLSKRLTFLVARKELGGGIVPLGGEWSAAEDGAKPDEAALRKTATRCAKECLGVDLSKCTKWTKFVEFTYRREDGSSSRTVMFIPNVWDCIEKLTPATQVKETKKEVDEIVEEEIPDEDDATKTKKVKKTQKVEKTIQTPQLRPHSMSLSTLIDYDGGRSASDSASEMGLFASAFDEMLQHHFTLELIDCLKARAAEVEQEKEKVEAEKKRKLAEEEAAAEAAKKQKLEDGEAKTVEAAKVEKPKTRLEQVINQAFLPPFQYFDRAGPTLTSAVRREALEGALHQLATYSKTEVDDLLSIVNLKKGKASSATQPVQQSLYYVRLATKTVEKVVEPEPEKVAEPAKEAAAEEAPAATEAAAMEEDGEETEEAKLNKMLLKDLRQMCTDKGLSPNGKKAELVQRILTGSE
eukprot:NODE_1250_length_1811_cov_495.597156_g1185_i0.p1 GENE.NODE_1250_length_1811_cov_495.597156_g1185_i0~~NODE_1250_length_1811_cov_495.597156_g1185_i0.p1  ORF type:complete len:552 (+),score=193.79 NODE_1250_length_1811_cov_495.597156_g1185_i0:59-1714(+)